MHDASTLLQPDSRDALARRGFQLDTTGLAALAERRSGLLRERDDLRAEQNRLARAIGGRGAHADQAPQPAAPDRAALRERAVAAKEELQKVEDVLQGCEHDLREFLLAVPNLPAASAPDGGPADPPVVVRHGGHRAQPAFAPRDHVRLGEATGMLDQARAAKLSGARFRVSRGAGARLERALAAFLLDLHTTEHGYQEYGLPHLVNTASMTATGQLPKFADDLFHTGGLHLIPTAEVPLVNLFRDEILDERALPLAVTAHTSCYRAEAGSYGRDTQGLIRLHQFEKVELVRLCLPEKADDELRLLLSHAEECLRRLDLHYRVVELRAGDLGFSARRTYDIEVWLPGQDAYREISSCSDCGPFQARRAGIRVRQGKDKVFPATLNGSGLPIGRTMVAIMEQHQRADGSIVIPAALRPYTGFAVVAPDGTPGD